MKHVIFLSDEQKFLKQLNHYMGKTQVLDKEKKNQSFSTSNLLADKRIQIT